MLEDVDMQRKGEENDDEWKVDERASIRNVEQMENKKLSSGTHTTSSKMIYIVHANALGLSLARTNPLLSTIYL